MPEKCAILSQLGLPLVPPMGVLSLTSFSTYLSALPISDSGILLLPPSVPRTLINPFLPHFWIVPGCVYRRIRVYLNGQSLSGMLRIGMTYTYANQHRLEQLQQAGNFQVGVIQIDQRESLCSDEVVASLDSARAQNTVRSESSLDPQFPLPGVGSCQSRVCSSP